MTNKLVVIINSLKYKLQLPPEPLTRGLPPKIPVLSVLCPQLNLLNPPRTKFLATPLKGMIYSEYFGFSLSVFHQRSVRIFTYLFVLPEEEMDKTGIF
jgi:hypothetical protein